MEYWAAFVTLSSRGLGHRPFTAVTRVRIPLGSPFDSAFIKASLMTTLRAANFSDELERQRPSRMVLSERSESKGKGRVARGSAIVRRFALFTSFSRFLLHS